MLVQGLSRRELLALVLYFCRSKADQAGAGVGWAGDARIWWESTCLGPSLSLQSGRAMWCVFFLQFVCFSSPVATSCCFARVRVVQPRLERIQEAFNNSA